MTLLTTYVKRPHMTSHIYTEHVEVFKVFTDVELVCDKGISIHKTAKATGIRYSDNGHTSYNCNITLK